MFKSNINNNDPYVHIIPDAKVGQYSQPNTGYNAGYATQPIENVPNLCSFKPEPEIKINISNIEELAMYLKIRIDAIDNRINDIENKINDIEAKIDSNDKDLKKYIDDVKYEMKSYTYHSF